MSQQQNHEIKRDCYLLYNVSDFSKKDVEKVLTEHYGKRVPEGSVFNFSNSYKTSARSNDFVKNLCIEFHISKNDFADSINCFHAGSISNADYVSSVYAGENHLSDDDLKEFVNFIYSTEIDELLELSDELLENTENQPPAETPIPAEDAVKRDEDLTGIISELQTEVDDIIGKRVDDYLRDLSYISVSDLFRDGETEISQETAQSRLVACVNAKYESVKSALLVSLK